MPSRRLKNRGDLLDALQRPRSVIFRSVEWSGPERAGRAAFDDFVERIERELPGLDLACWILADESEPVTDWLASAIAPFGPGTGSGEVIWVQEGAVARFVVHAAVVGAEGLVRITRELWATD